LSSILKALKRIEGQAPAPQSFPALPNTVDAKRAVTSNARKRWLRRRFITVGLVLLAIVMAAVIAFQQKLFEATKLIPTGSQAAKGGKSSAPEEKSKIFKAKISPAPVKQTTRKTGPTGPARQKATSVAPGPKVKKIRTNKRSSASSDNLGQKSRGSMPAVASKQPQGGATSDKPSPKHTTRKKLVPSKNSIAGKRTASSKSAAAIPPTKKEKSYAKLNDSQIKLQALAWSSNAAKRIAVINGHIVREGESMDGYQVYRIRQEDVVITDGKRSWSLEF
jgi:hypothetical protein